MLQALQIPKKSNSSVFLQHLLQFPISIFLLQYKKTLHSFSLQDNIKLNLMRFKGAQFQYIWNDKPIYK